jgi:hypothetical protein
MIRIPGFRRLAAGLFAACTALAVAPAASAASAPVKFDASLTALWTTVLETPSAQNAFGTGGAAFTCWNLGGGTVAPFGPSGVPSCTVKPGTKILVAASSSECSTMEQNGTTQAELRACAEQNDAQTAPSVAVDGHRVPVKEVETPPMDITLPAGNIFDLPAGTTGLSVAHGWVAHLDPLTPGTHTIVGSGPTFTFTTTIIVASGS